MSKCNCGKGGTCFTNNYDIVGDGVARAKRPLGTNLFTCNKFKESIEKLRSADLVSRK